MHNSFPSKSIFKSVIHLCCHPDVTTPLNNSDQLSQSVTELLWNMCGNLAWVIMKKNDHRIGKYLCYHEIWLHQPFSRTTPVLSLEHLIPMSHTALLQFIHDAPSFPPAALISGGRGACILHSVRVGIWIGLSLLEQSLAAWSRLPPPSPHLVMTPTSCLLEEQWAEILGVLCTVTFPPVMMFRYYAGHYCFLCRKLRGRVTHLYCWKFSACFILYWPVCCM